ncbi:MAG: transposase [Prevotella sp.]|nr:transposase [Prevotella sp.]
MPPTAGQADNVGAGLVPARWPARASVNNNNTHSTTRIPNNMPDSTPLANRHNSLRLQSFDYSAQCCIFITIVTQGRMCRFGHVHDGQMMLNPAGEMVDRVYRELLNDFTDMVDIAHVIMPNHVHLLLANNGTSSIPEVIRRFKSKTTHDYIQGIKEHGWPEFDIRLWQTRFYDVIIKNACAHDYVLHYINNNPLRWSLDRLNAFVDAEHADDVNHDLKTVNW